MSPGETSARQALRLTSFPPVVAADTRVLILGSMPGSRSLAEHEYYAHPRNLFWPMMDDLFGIDRTWSYERRLEALLARGIGLWDVLKHCERAGSLDASIVRQTEVPNDFAALLPRLPKLRAVAFNGQKAEQAFRRQVSPLLPADTVAAVVFLSLPSTSPANASKSWAEKRAQWEAVASFVGD